MMRRPQRSPLFPYRPLFRSEYGGAAVYVAEHVPDHKRGFYTSFIQITATLGLFVSLGVVLAVKESMPEAAFKAWGRSEEHTSELQSLRHLRCRLLPSHKN